MLNSYLTNKPLEGRTSETLDYIGGIVGGDEPSKYSRSPVLWNRFFEALGIRGFFTALDLPPERSFATFTNAALAIAGWIDLTVTSPYKGIAYQSLSFLPVKMTVAERVHYLKCLNHIIVNPLTREAYVDITDGQGMIRALRRRRKLKGSRILLVGAGGAATAIAYELVCEGANLTIANIIYDDAKRLVQRLQQLRLPFAELCVCDWGNIRNEAHSKEIIISAISSSTPLDRKGIENLPDECLLVDTRYGARAEFVKIARSAGRECVDGREMLYGQFVLAAEIFSSFIGNPLQSVNPTLTCIEEWFLSQDLHAGG